VGALTDVGAYDLSASPVGTFDQGGNLWEWNEEIAFGTNRGDRGGSWDNPYILPASAPFQFNPTIENETVIRVGLLRWFSMMAAPTSSAEPPIAECWSPATRRSTSSSRRA
jgi:hypothetical protein